MGAKLNFTFYMFFHYHYFLGSIDCIGKTFPLGGGKALFLSILCCRLFIADWSPASRLQDDFPGHFIIH